MKLLIVEHNPGFRRLIGELLAPLAPDICECADDAEVLSAYETHWPDVVLMDLAVRAAEGLRAMAQLVAAHPEARVVVVLQYDDPALREAARLAGACGDAVKDNLLELRQLVKRANARNPGRARGSG